MVAAIILLAQTSARADCTPAAANNVTATCTGTTTNQGGGAPGSSGGNVGYGTLNATGLTVIVGSNATVTGNDAAIEFANGSVTNNIGALVSASLLGGTTGVLAWSGSVNVTNSGSIIGASAIQASTNATVTNNIGATISGHDFGITANGLVDVTNSGSITTAPPPGFLVADIQGGRVSVINNVGATISSGSYGIGIFGTGNSSVFNAGTISGMIAIELTGGGNTLTLGTTSVISGNVLVGAGTLQLGGTGAASFDVSQLGVQYQGFSTFNKVSASTWTLTGTSTFAGPVNVNGGTLLVNGDISAASSLTVNTGTSLGGMGVVGATTVSSGAIFTPGNNIPGTSMTVNGNLALASGAEYVVFLNPTTASFASVTGTATLGGATVNAFYANGSYLSKQYTILTAVGGLGGSTFGSVVNTNLPANFHTTLTYDANDAYLNLALNFGIPRGLNPSQQAVGNALTNFFNSTGGIPMLYGALTATGLTQASGESATGTQQTTFQAMSQFMGVMTDPFLGRGNGINGATSPGQYAEDDQASAYAARRKTDAFAMFTKAPPVTFVQRWSVWASGFGGSQSTSGNAGLGSSDTTSRIAGTAVGADYLVSPDTIAGFALAGGGTSFGVNNLGSGRSDLFQAGGYVRHTEGAAYISGALAYGWQDITTDRTVAIAGIDHLRAEFRANAFSGRVEGGYRFVVATFGGIGITPYAAGQFTTFDLPAYAEGVVSGTPAFALAYAAKNVTDSRSELGFRSDKSFAIQSGVLILRGRFAWAHDFDPDRNISATFQALPGASFVVGGAALAPNSALTTASAEMKWINGWSVAGTFEGEFSNVTQSYAGKGVVRYAW
jgi:autotransporter-associated beta strand protein